MAFGILWFFITISVESSIIPISDIIFEHRMYLPSVGIISGIVSIIFITRERIEVKWPKIGRLVIPLLALTVLVMSFATYSRNMVWRNQFALWEDVVQKNPRNHRGHNMIGIIYKEKGQIENAIGAFRMSLQIKPDYAEAHVNLGNAYLTRGMLDDALREFMTALSLQSLDRIDTAGLYQNIGAYFMKKGLSDKAIEYFRYAELITPESASVYYNLAIAFSRKGLHRQAAEFFNKAHLLNPDKY
jgi:Tfp pilus assembly protein PilF